MNSFVVILSCLAAITAANPAQDVLVQYLSNGGRRCVSNCRSTNPLADCPPVNCPPAVRDGNCGVPDCSLPGNRLRLHPHPDPNFFYQCVPNGPVGPLVAMRRPCACETLFSANVDENRCVHSHEWRPDCSSHGNNPILSREFCRVECPDCDGGSPSPSPPVTQPPPTAEVTIPTPSPPITPGPITPGPPGGNCPCPCFPCVWWPCQPCPNSCPCTNNNQQPQQPQQPRPW